MKISLPIKFALLALVVAGIGVLGISYYSYRDAGSLLRSQSLQRLGEGLSREALLLTENIDRMRSDVRMISASETVLGYIRAVDGDGFDDLGNMTAELWRQRLAIDFTSMLRQRPEYDQIRYIGIAADGMEIVRVERRDGRISLVPDKDLQREGQRDYFGQALRLDADQQYVSEIALDRERGTIAAPMHPVVRVASSIRSESGQKFGVVVINGDFEKIARIFETPPENVSYLIADSRGDYVSHPDKSRAFTLARGGDAGLKADFPDIDWGGINPPEGEFLTFDLPDRTASLIVQRLYLAPLNKDNFLYLSALASHAVIEEQSAGFGKRLLLGVIAVVSILFAAMALLARRMMAPIRILTAAADGIASGDEDVWLPAIERNDELGVLAKSFRTMLNRQSETRNELRALAESLEGKVEERTIELTLAISEADNASKAKSEFLSSMSHELRTPMNAVLGFAQMLKLDRKSPLSADQKEHVDCILEGGNHLLELINEVLDLARIEAGKLSLNLEQVNANEVVADCIALINHIGESRRIEIIDQFSDGPEAILRTDPLRLKQALINILSNAVKYNIDGGTVTVRGRVVDGGFLRLSVIDTGVGIASKNYDRVFHMFHRAGTDPMISREGTGVGLAVTKMLMEQMAGRIGFKTEEGHGSTFWIELPLSSNKDALIWTDAMRVGIDAIDRDHQMLFLLTNRVSGLSGESTDLDGIIQELNDYVRGHFRREEAIMEVCDYPNLEEHRDNHRQIAGQLNDLAAAWRREHDPETLGGFRQLLRSTWIDHIVNKDIEIRQYARGRGEDIKRALDSLR